MDISQIDREQALATYHGEDEVDKASVVIARYLADNPVGDTYNSGLSTLDGITGGFFPGQLVIISGITGQGKTTLAQTFTHTLMLQGSKPLWLSYEVAYDDFAKSFMPDSLNHFCLPSTLKGNTLEWIDDRLLESKLKFNTKVLFIDHLHYLVTMSPKTNTSFIIGETVRGLKQMAIRHKVIIFLVAHMQKTKPDEEPGLGHIRDSSFVEQEADLVLYVWRWADDKSITICKVAKNRKRGVIDERIRLKLVDRRYKELSNETPSMG